MGTALGLNIPDYVLQILKEIGNATGDGLSWSTAILLMVLPTWCCQFGESDLPLGISGEALLGRGSLCLVS